MDNNQVCALRHKRHIIASNIVFDDDTVADLADRRLITPLMLDNMKDEIANFVRVVKYLELLEDNPKDVSRGSFDRLCEFIQLTHAWITDELRAELKTVRGELTVDGYVRNEADRLVGFEFGPIKRLTSSEKRDIAVIVSIRMQHYKEVWKRAIADAERRLADLARINSEKEAHLKRLLDMVRQYTRVNTNLYKTLAKVDTTLVSDDELQQILMNNLSHYITHLREISSTSIQARREVRNEKHRALRLVGVEDINAKLHVEVNKTMDPIDGELGQLNDTLKQLQQQNANYKAKLVAIEDDRKVKVAAADEEISRQTERLNAARERGNKLRSDLHRLQQSIIQVNNRLAKYEIKNAVLDQARFRGYTDTKEVVLSRVDKSERMSKQRASVFDISLPENVVLSSISPSRRRQEPISAGVLPVSTKR